MSEDSSTPHSQPKIAARNRLLLYAAAACAVVLALAYVDGGEEPIRPIVQQITQSPATGSSATGTTANEGQKR